MFDALGLFAQTVILRPYVFIFLGVYMVAAAAHLGVRRMLWFIPLGYGLAWLSEFASIHWGIPYGDYYYIPNTVGRELWVWGVPFMDSLSYVFLSYCSYATAMFILSPVLITRKNAYIFDSAHLRQSWQALVLGAFLFVLLDIIIDPVALQGDRWFLGQIYGYRSPGFYFGIPLSNFAGWLVVGLIMIAALQRLSTLKALESKAGRSLARVPFIQLLGLVLYVSVLAFNLGVTFWIGETFMGIVGCLILFFPGLLVFFFTLYKQAHLTANPHKSGSTKAALSTFDKPLGLLLRSDDHLSQLGDGKVQKSG